MFVVVLACLVAIALLFVSHRHIRKHNAVIVWNMSERDPWYDGSGSGGSSYYVAARPRFGRKSGGGRHGR